MVVNCGAEKQVQCSALKSSLNTVLQGIQNVMNHGDNEIEDVIAGGLGGP